MPEHVRVPIEAKERGSPDELTRVLCEANREYVSAMLGLQVWAHKLHECAESAPHEADHHTG